jgi:hypothetical protein
MVMMQSDSSRACMRCVAAGMDVDACIGSQEDMERL